MTSGDSVSDSFAFGNMFQACIRRGSRIGMVPPPWLKAMRSFGWRAPMPPVIIEAQASAISPGKHTACSEKAPTMRSWPAGRSACTNTAERFYYDELLFDPESVKFLVKRFGASQVVLGTDYPFALGDTDPLGSLGKAGLDEKTRTLITSTNAKRFLGLPEAPR